MKQKLEIFDQNFVQLKHFYKTSMFKYKMLDNIVQFFIQFLSGQIWTNFWHIFLHAIEDFLNCIIVCSKCKQNH